MSPFQTSQQPAPYPEGQGPNVLYLIHIHFIDTALPIKVLIKRQIFKPEVGFGRQMAAPGKYPRIARCASAGRDCPPRTVPKRNDLHIPARLPGKPASVNLGWQSSGGDETAPGSYPVKTGDLWSERSAAFHAAARVACAPVPAGK